MALSRRNWMLMPGLSGGISWSIVARYREKSVGMRTQPCLNPNVMGNCSVSLLLWNTCSNMPSCRAWTRPMKCSRSSEDHPHGCSWDFVLYFLYLSGTEDHVDGAAGFSEAILGLREGFLCDNLQPVQTCHSDMPFRHAFMQSVDQAYEVFEVFRGPSTWLFSGLCLVFLVFVWHRRSC